MRDALDGVAAPVRRPRAATPSTTALALTGPLAVADDEFEVAVHPVSDDRPVLLSIDELSVGYDQPSGETKIVVHDVSVLVRRGEVHGLIGESGSGKTQTAWSVLGLLPAGGRVLSGSIVFDGHDLVEGARPAGVIGRRIAYIPQEPMSNLDPSFTIGSQLIDPLRHHLGIGRKEAAERALALLERVGIKNPDRVMASYPHQISGGMAQRVLIAGAVSCGPDLLIADEPTTALDVTVQAEVLDLIRDLRDELGMGVLLVTHNFGVVADLCDTVSVMRQGRVVETGDVRSVFREPRRKYTKALLEAILEGGPARGALDAAAAEGEKS